MPPSGSGLPTDQSNWIKQHLIPDYITQSNQLSCSDLRDYRHGLYARFCAQFPEQDEGSKSKKQFMDFLRNKKTVARTKSLIAQGRSQPANPHLESANSSKASILSDSPANEDLAKFWSSVFHRDRMTGRSLFERQNRQSLNDYVNQERMRLGLDHRQHPAMLKARAKESWEKLDETVQESWNTEAKALEDSDAMETLRLSENQAILAKTLPLVLRQLIGPLKEGRHKIGNAKFHVLYGFRNDDDVIETGYIDVTQNSTDRPFIDFCDDYEMDIARAWTTCCTSTIKDNRPEPSVVATTTTFSRDPRGCPIFPALPSDLNVLRTVLSDFIQEQWTYSHPNSPFPTKLKSYLTDPELPLIDPLYEKSFSPVVALAEAFLGKQKASGGAYELFLTAPIRPQTLSVGDPSQSTSQPLSVTDPKTPSDASVPPGEQPTSVPPQTPKSPAQRVPFVEDSDDHTSPCPPTPPQPSPAPLLLEKPADEPPQNHAPMTLPTPGPMTVPADKGVESVSVEHSKHPEVDQSLPLPRVAEIKSRKPRKRKAEAEPDLVDSASKAPRLETGAPRTTRRTAQKHDSSSGTGPRKAPVANDTVILRSGKTAKASKNFYYVRAGSGSPSK